MRAGVAWVATEYRNVPKALEASYISEMYTKRACFRSTSRTSLLSLLYMTPTPMNAGMRNATDMIANFPMKGTRFKSNSAGLVRS